MRNNIASDNGLGIDYLEGQDIKKVLKFNDEWSASLALLINDVCEKHQAETEEEIIECLMDEGFQDFHWNWASKALAFSNDEYKWFSAESGESIEAVVITKHPVTSEIDTQNIFYIEYICVAPWNRAKVSQTTTPKKGLGTGLIKVTLKYFNESEGYRQGCSLHSLPQSCPYYTKIGMQRIPSSSDKQGLTYFEMPQNVAEELCNE
ncbi:GNAT family N-acetyltransferase [Idiomarina loihiensis]|jgi:hypothetical protein|uniref:Predicted acetyltransferase, GNAT family n=1 Tax=Idiomarina loihiensis (strain ATCC BAA-735 / DSM 15497 / L2-TR) TaxID=283942 RepID=Q5QVK8_IDILO|nr:GNAT family N-acetyltransferase [Idiomarina loihiensis]AAV83029.1 Predicted acetyltransferase, GNAT family [Idiomarina loihiensis L2TR]AGM37074.1 GNAT family acetyltransferase [Idiomarina loihiensis GSL 199]